MAPLRVYETLLSYSWWYWDSERLSNLPNVPQLNKTRMLRLQLGKPGFLVSHGTVRKFLEYIYKYTDKTMHMIHKTGTLHASYSWKLIKSNCNIFIVLKFQWGKRKKLTKGHRNVAPITQFTSVWLFIHVRLFVTPWTAARQASLSITNSQSLLKLMSIVSVMPSNHLILCHPLLLLSSILPSIRVFSNESVLHIRWPKHWTDLPQ